MDSWAYWGPSTPSPPFLHFSFPSFFLLLHCRHSGEINAEEKHCFHPPAATSAIPRKKRNQNPPSAWIWLFSSLLNKEICSCAAKNRLLFWKKIQIPEFPSVVSMADVAFLSVGFVFFSDCKSCDLVFFIAPTRGQHSLPNGGWCLFIMSTGGADEEVNIDSVDVWTVTGVNWALGEEAEGNCRPIRRQ